MDCDKTDYSLSGMDIQHAMLDCARRFPQREIGPRFIRWKNHRIATADCMAVPKSGRVRVEFLRVNAEVKQGLDLKLAGYIELPDGKHVALLRTWHDPKLPTV